MSKLSFNLKPGGLGASSSTGATATGTGTAAKPSFGLKLGGGATGATTGTATTTGAAAGTSTAPKFGLKIGGTTTTTPAAGTAGTAGATGQAGATTTTVGTATTTTTGTTGGLKLGGGLGTTGTTGGLKLGGTSGFKIGGLGTGTGTTTGTTTGGLTSTTGTAAGTTGQQVFVRLDTLFSALPANYKTAFSETESLIRSQAVQRDRIQDHFRSMAQRTGSGSAQAQAEAIDTLAQRLSQLYMNVCAESRRLEDLKQRVTAEVRYAEIAESNMTRLSNEDSVYSGTGLRETLVLPSQYHWQKLQSYGTRAEEIRRRIDELSDALSLDAGGLAADHDFDGLGGSGSEADQASLLQQVLAEQYEAVIAVASNIEALARGAQELRSLYVEVHRQQTGQDATQSALFKHRETNVRMDMDSGSFKPYSAQATTSSAPTAAAANAALVSPTDAQGNPVVVPGTQTGLPGTTGTATGTTAGTGTAGTATGTGLAKPAFGLAKPAGTGFGLSKGLLSNSNTTGTAATTTGATTTVAGPATGTTATTGTTTGVGGLPKLGTTSTFKLGGGTGTTTATSLGAKRPGEGAAPSTFKPIALSFGKK